MERILISAWLNSCFQDVSPRQNAFHQGPHAKLGAKPWYSAGIFTRISFIGQHNGEYSGACRPINVWFEHGVQELIHWSRYTQLPSHSHYRSVNRLKLQWST